MPLIVFTVRTRNIYGLGLFNDCWAMLFAYAGVLVMATTDQWSVASALLSFGISVKMNVLLFIPGFVGLVWSRQGWWGLLRQGAVGAGVQLLCGAWFLSAAPGEYIGAAFNLGR
jgi:alpha-1,3-mannosyltransferase